MNLNQQKALDAAKNHLAEFDDICGERISEFSRGVVYVQIETWLKDCQSKVVQELTRHCFEFMIGRNGGYYIYNNNNHREYISKYQIFRKAMLY